MDIEELTAIEEIRRLKARYCHLFDQSRWDELMRLFAPDATVRGSGNMPAFELSGTDEILAGYQSFVVGARTCHIAANPDIRVAGPDTAEGTWTMSFCHHDDRYNGYGHYNDRYERVDGEWRFKDIEMVLDFAWGTTVDASV